MTQLNFPRPYYWMFTKTERQWFYWSLTIINRFISLYLSWNSNCCCDVADYGKMERSLVGQRHGKHHNTKYHHTATQHIIAWWHNGSRSKKPDR